ncbi:hypothetical protein CEXT_658981 [Caerostris extrusa]|uniref:Uncharacterized protein n=1 Tax=Caerostris extrusa TaxID=172846 RepID=A0AAV4P296_CAEEX|nr:hypothetical protein CEXT_658981 [Caerostris extrusa]
MSMYKFLQFPRMQRQLSFTNSDIDSCQQGCLERVRFLHRSPLAFRPISSVFLTLPSIFFRPDEVQFQLRLSRLEENVFKESPPTHQPIPSKHLIEVSLNASPLSPKYKTLLEYILKLHNISTFPI